MICSYDTAIVKKFGLVPAVLLQQIEEQRQQAVEKAAEIEGYFKLNYSIVTTRTGVSRVDQDAIINSFCKCGILKKKRGAPDYFQLNEITDENSSEFKLQDKLSQKEVEKNVKLKHLRSKIETQNTELLQAYWDWIEAVYDKLGWLSPKAIEIAQKDIDNFSKRDLDVALDVLTIATINGYRDVTWAIKLYCERTQQTPQVRTTVCVNDTHRKLSEEVF